MSDWNQEIIDEFRGNGGKVGTERVSVEARLADGEEYKRIWDKQKADYPFFAEYEAKTARDHIPVVILERRT